jgi:molecular chaperone GrpE (heat shock protein)
MSQILNGFEKIYFGVGEVLDLIIHKIRVASFLEQILIVLVVIIVLILMYFLFIYLVKIYLRINGYSFLVKNLDELKDVALETNNTELTSLLNVSSIIVGLFDAMKREIKDDLKHNYNDLSELEFKYREETKRIGDYINKLVSAIKTTANGQTELSGRIKNIEEGQRLLIDDLRKKDELLRNYQDGYDYSKNKTIINKLIELVNQLDLLRNKNPELISGIINLIEINIFQYLSIYQIDASIGKDVDYNFMKVAGVIKTSEESKHEKIAEIIQNGYYIQVSEDSKKRLVSSIIKVFKYEKGDNE